MYTHLINSNKKIFIINGKGGSGKDTFVENVNKYVPTDNYSSIESIKQVAELLGWDGGKSDKDRKFLSDLKKLSSDYNDMPYTDILHYISYFLTSMYNEDELLFVHIREPKEIEKVRSFYENNGIYINTIYIHNNRLINKTYHNDADDNVVNYKYDYYVDNSGSIDDLDKEVREFIKSFQIRPFIRVDEEEIYDED